MMDWGIVTGEDYLQVYGLLTYLLMEVNLS
jgi:hypothetical protein